MSKSRLEAFSDGVFAIVMTLLVFDLKLPEHVGQISNAELWSQLLALWPSITSFALSFLVLAVFWINHSFLFHTYAKTIDRSLNLMNMVYLLFLVFVPFSAHLFGTYPYNQPAAIVYGLNILAVILMFRLMFLHVYKTQNIKEEVSSRLVKQARVRTLLSIGSYMVGIICSFVFIPASVFFYLFPMIFNIIPGTLNLAEKVFRFELT
jgi:uncharacterized membrane protein